MTSASGALTLRLAAFVFALSASGCAVIGLVGGTAVDVVRKHPPESVSPAALAAVTDGSRLTLTLLDSTAVEGKKLSSRPSDYDSTKTLSVLRIQTTRDDSRAGEPLVIPISHVVTATVAGRRNAGQKAAEAGTKTDLVVIKAATGLVLVVAVIVGIFGLVLVSSSFSF